jgi:hypothetical protein
MKQKAVLEAANLPSWLASIRAETRLMAPIKRGRVSHAFSWVDDPADVQLDYVRTVLPAKQALLPSREQLLKLRREPYEASPVTPDERFVLFGAHPCDGDQSARLVDAEAAQRRGPAVPGAAECGDDRRGGLRARQVLLLHLRREL